MRPALTFSTRRAKSSKCLWQTCSNVQCIEQFFNHYKQSPPIIKHVKPSLYLLNRSNSTHALKRQEEDVSGHEKPTKIHPRMMNKELTLDALIAYLSNHKLNDVQKFATLRTALYNTTQYDHEKAWMIYKNMVQYKVDGFLKPNHYGNLLCILKFGHSPLRLLEVIEDMKKHITPNNYHYSQVLYALQRSGLAEEACNQLQNISDPRPYHYHSLVVALKKCKNLDEKILERATELMLEGMKKHNAELDNATRAMTVALLADYKQSELILKFLKAVDSVNQKKHKKTNRPYNVYMYTSLISGCARQSDGIGAKLLYDEMKKNKLKPNQVTYTALMEAYGRSGDFTSAIRLMTKHQRQYKKVNNSMITSLVVNALRHDKVEVAENAITFMTKKKVQLHQTDGELRAAILWLKTKRDVSVARKYFDDLYMQDKKYVNNVMINHLVKKYGREGDKENAMKVYKKQFKLPIPLTNREKSRTKHHLVDALFHCRDVPAAIGVFISMRNQAMSDEITMAMIVKGLVLNDEGELAWRIFKTLQANGTEPNLHAYTSILKSLADKGSYMKKKVKINMDRLDPDLLKSAGIRLSDLNFNHSPVPVTTEALQLFRRLTGFHKPNVYIYTTLISCFAKNNIYQAINVFEHMCSQQVHPTVETYTALLQGCAIFRNSDISFAVFKHMQANQVEPNQLTWQYLLKSMLRSRLDKMEVDVVAEVARMALENKKN